MSTEARLRAAVRTMNAASVTRNDPKLPTADEYGLPNLPRLLDDALTPQQCAAIGHLVAGRTLNSTAALLNISRKTLYNWRRMPLFRATLNATSREALEAVSTRVRNLMLRGTRTLEATLEHPRSFGEALKITSNRRLWDIANILLKETDDDVGDESAAPATTRSAGPRDPADALPTNAAQEPAPSVAPHVQPITTHAEQDGPSEGTA